MDILMSILFGCAGSASTALVLWLVARWLGRRSAIVGRAGRGLAIAVGYAVGHAFIVGWPPLPPPESSGWLPYLGLAAVACGLPPAGRPIAAWIGRIALTATTFGLILHPLVASSWKPAEAAAWLGGGAALMLASWASLDGLARRLPTAAVLLILLPIAASTVVVIFYSASLIVSLLAFGLSAALAGALLVSIGDPPGSKPSAAEMALADLDKPSDGPARLAGGAVAVATVLLFGLWLMGTFYAEVPYPSALLLASAPSAAWAGAAGPIRRKSAWLAALVGAIAVLVPAIAAAVIAIQLSPSFDV
jgi:hypothetical protein